MTSPANVLVVVPNTEGKLPTGYATLLNPDKTPFAPLQAEKAAFVADADDTNEASLAASIDAIRDALVAAGLMEADEEE